MDEDEKKAFDAEAGGPADDIGFPDPEEVMAIQAQLGRNWIVKMPKYLLERWAQVTQAQIPLATIRRYPNDRFFLVVPRDPPPPPPAPGAPPLATEDTHDVFELDVVAREPQNAYVVAQRPKPGADVRSRARDTALHGRVGVEMNARPRLSADYEARVRARQRAADTPTRTVLRMDADAVGGQGQLNRMASGVAHVSERADFVKTKAKPAKGQFERMARIPRNQLLDLLFEAFRAQAYWPLRALRERTQQPEQYLKEVLTEVASLHRAGEHAGTYELKPQFAADGTKSEADLYAKTEFTKAEDAMDEDEDDDDEDDMEEVG